MYPNSWQYCNGPNEEKGPTEEGSCSGNNSEEAHENVDDLYIVDKHVRHVRSGPQLEYVMQ